MANVGYVGLGVMGGHMAERLLEKGHTVTGYNRTRSKAQWLIDKGMKWADSPRAVAAPPTSIFSMVTNSQALSQIAEGPNGMLEGLGPGKVWIEMGTVSPAVSRAWPRRCGKRAPIWSTDRYPAASSPFSRESSRSWSADGRKRSNVSSRSCSISAKVTHVGENGLALVMKIATNLGLPRADLAFTEGVLLAEKSGIPRETAVEVFLHSVLLANASVSRPIRSENA